MTGAVIPAAAGWVVRDRISPIVGWSAGERVNGPVIWDVEHRTVGVAPDGTVAFSLADYQGAGLTETDV